MTTVAMGEQTASETPDVEPAAAKRRRAARLLPVASVAGGTALIGAHGSLYGNWIIDDAAITFAYARSFAEGLGPVVQPGAEPVEGYSNPTWTALLVLGRLVGLFDRGTIFGIPDYVLFPKALSLLLVAGILWGCHVAAARVTKRPWLATLAVGGLLAVTPSFVIWTFAGLENPLYALIITWMAVLVFLAVLDDRLLRGKLAVGMGLLAAAAALTRPEGLIYAGVYPLVVLGALRKPRIAASVKHILLSVAAFAVPVGAYFLWRYATFGLWLSSPSIAKRQDLPTLQELTRPGELVGYAGAPAVLVAVLFVGMVLARPAWWRRGLLALLVPLGLAVVAFSVLEADWMSQLRFATPVWVLGSLVATLAAADVLRHAKLRGRVWIVVGLVAVLLPTGAAFGAVAKDFRTEPDISACYVADRFGRIFNGYADVMGAQNASLLIPDLGGSALTSRLHLVDMAGLTNHRFAELVRDQDLRGQQNYVYDEVKPTFIHTREPWSTGNGLGYDPRLARDYYPIHYDIYQGAPHGDWVRKDAVRDQQMLEDLRAYARVHTVQVERDIPNWPRRHCGDTLRAGQTHTGEA
ncbi:hypothetical protein DI005_00315 [Prauserella sp. PE36]|uniref:hypothetical protein n=1 Tax=Prauserella sp. PE36 TaxID=1504709 RepID=UPI000DE1A8D6|nr:hypothetical protein [Prauserella sp. PE36]RBM24438.1 hypothetical protein DI005_00315 [Prauserella sp. PE36]